MLASQRKMLAAVSGERGAGSTNSGSTLHAPRSTLPDTQLRRTFATQAKRIRAWLDRLPNVELLAVDHRQIIANPQAGATDIAAFLGNGLDVAAMAAAVEPGLYRVRR